MLITFIGDVNGVLAAPASVGNYYLTVIDQTTKSVIRISCPAGPLAEFAQKAKRGQVVQATGWGTIAYGSTFHMNIPLVLRAQSGTNEAELNDLSGQYIRQLGDAITGAELKKVRTELANQEKMINTRDQQIVQLQKELQYERLLNGAIEE